MSEINYEECPEYSKEHLSLENSGELIKTIGYCRAKDDTCLGNNCIFKKYHRIMDTCRYLKKRAALHKDYSPFALLTYTELSSVEDLED